MSPRSRRRPTAMRPSRLQAPSGRRASRHRSGQLAAGAPGPARSGARQRVGPATPGGDQRDVASSCGSPADPSWSCWTWWASAPSSSSAPTAAILKGSGPGCRGRGRAIGERSSRCWLWSRAVAQSRSGGVGVGPAAARHIARHDRRRGHRAVPTDWSPPTCSPTPDGTSRCWRPRTHQAAGCPAPGYFGPGWISDVCSAFFPLAVASPVIRALGSSGTACDGATHPSCARHPRLDGAAALWRDPLRTADGLDRDSPGDGPAWLDSTRYGNAPAPSCWTPCSLPSRRSGPGPSWPRR